jgi:hypothetical protein
MKSISAKTNAVHEEKVASEARAYFSTQVARLKEGVWMRVETRWVADGAIVRILIWLEGDGRREQVGRPYQATIADNQAEVRWWVDLPQKLLDETAGEIRLVFDASIEGYSLEAKSQTLFVHRTRFSA